MNEIPAMPAQATMSALLAARPTPAQLAQLSVSFGEPVPVARLRESWTRMASGHEALRSGFRPSGGKLFRIAGEVAGTPWRELDWKDVPPADLPARWADELAADAARPLDASLAPALRFLAITLPGGSTHVLATFPRFLVDEESLFFVLCEWIESLEGAGNPPPPSPGDSRVVSADRDWWAASLTGAVGGPMRYFGPGEAVPAEFSSLLDRETTRGLQALCAKHEIAPSTFFLGAWGLLVARLSARPEATILAACEDPGAAAGAGFRTNFLPARVHQEIGEPAIAWLRRLDSAERKRASEASIAIGDLAWDGWKNLPAAYAFHPPALNDRIPEAFPRWINLDARLICQPLHPLELEVRDGPRYGLRLRSEALPAPVSAKLLSWIEGLAAAILADPDAPCGSFAFGTAEQPAPKLKASAVPPVPVHTAASDMAADLPLAVVVEDLTGAALTAAEVEAHATLFAGHLAKENLAGGWAAGVCLTPSPWVPVAILGILRAGDTCVPLDPSADPAWLEARAKEADCEFVVCDSGTAPAFAAGSRKVVVIDRDWESFSSDGAPSVDPPKTALFLPGTPAATAPPIAAFPPDFVSTACSRSVRLMQLGQGDRLMVPVPAPGAGMVEGVLCACLTGATAVLVGKPASLMETISAAKPTHLRLTAAEFRSWVNELDASGAIPPDSLKVVLVDSADGSTATRSLKIWQEREKAGRREGTRAAWRHFLSPCSFAGIGLLFAPGDVDGEVGLGDFLPAGVPTRACGFTFEDPAGGAPPPGFPGELRFAPLHSGSRVAGWLGWRDSYGQFHVLDDSRALERAALLVPGVRDAAVDPTGVVWFCGSADEHAVAAALRARFPAVEKAVRVPSIPLAGGFCDYSALEVPKPAARPERPKPAAGAAPDAKIPRTDVPSPAAEQAPLSADPGVPAAAFVELAGLPESPALYLLLPDGCDSARDCELLAGFLKSDWRVFAGTVGTDKARLAAAFRSESPVHLAAIGQTAPAAIELAAALRRSGREVPYVVLAGARAPSAPRSEKPRAGGWLGALTGKFARPSAPAPGASIDGPLGVVLTSDCADEDGWLAVAPQAATETISYYSTELLGAGAQAFAAALSKLAGFDGNP